jgi:hypothetical protein
MPGSSPSDKVPGQGFLARVLPRLVLNAVMSLAVFALDRRLRRAFRHEAASDGKPGAPAGDTLGPGQAQL